MPKMARPKVVKLLAQATRDHQDTSLFDVVNTSPFKVVCECGGECLVIADYSVYAELSTHICCPRCQRGVSLR